MSRCTHDAHTIGLSYNCQNPIRQENNTSQLTDTIAVHSGIVSGCYGAHSESIPSPLMEGLELDMLVTQNIRIWGQPPANTLQQRAVGVRENCCNIRN